MHMHVARARIFVSIFRRFSFPKKHTHAAWGCDHLSICIAINLNITKPLYTILRVEIVLSHMAWSAKSQSALEVALRQTRKPLSANRKDIVHFWEDIARRVGGHSAQSCWERFKQIRYALLEETHSPKKAAVGDFSLFQDDVDDKTIPWDGAQIVKFQDVLRKYPRTLESQERWRLIAIDMNKSVDACKHAFREIAASIRTGQPLSIAKVNLIQESSNMTVT